MDARPKRLISDWVKTLNCNLGSRAVSFQIERRQKSCNDDEII